MIKSVKEKHGYSKWTDISHEGPRALSIAHLMQRISVVFSAVDTTKLVNHLPVWVLALAKADCVMTKVLLRSRPAGIALFI